MIKRFGLFHPVLCRVGASVALVLAGSMSGTVSAQSTHEALVDFEKMKQKSVIVEGVAVSAEMPCGEPDTRTQDSGSVSSLCADKNTFYLLAVSTGIKDDTVFPIVSNFDQVFEEAKAESDLISLENGVSNGRRWFQVVRGPETKVSLARMIEVRPGLIAAALVVRNPGAPDPTDADQRLQALTYLASLKVVEK